MPKQDFKEYSRLRAIATKRLERLAEKEPGYANIHIPKVAELKGESPETIAKAIKNLETYVAKGASLSRRRESARQGITPGMLRARKRVAREYERDEGATTYQGYMKGIAKLGINIPPSKVPAFIKYMDYRLAQGKAAFKYAFATFAEDFERIMNRKYSPDDIIGDFESFTRDYQRTQKKAQRMQGWSSQKFKNAWERYLEARGAD